MPQNKTITVVLGALITALAVWYVFLRDTTSAPLLTTQDLTVAAGSGDREVIETLLQLRTITLAGTILSDPAFLQLTDTGTQITPEPVGRENPFLPLLRTAATTTSSSSPVRGN